MEDDGATPMVLCADTAIHTSRIRRHVCIGLGVTIATMLRTATGIGSSWNGYRPLASNGMLSNWLIREARTASVPLCCHATFNYLTAVRSQQPPHIAKIRVLEIYN
jgi:hypothetical protein